MKDTMKKRTIEFLVLSLVGLLLVSCSALGLEETENDTEVLALVAVVSANQSSIPEVELGAYATLNPGDTNWEQNKTLRVMRCAAGMTWDGTNCTGTAGTYQFCSVLTNDCNAGDRYAEMTAPEGWTNGATSSVYNACAELNTRNDGAGFAGINTWRLGVCGADNLAATTANCEMRAVMKYIANNTSLFPGIAENTPHWTGESVSNTSGVAVTFVGTSEFSGGQSKTSNYPSICVSDG